MELYYYKNKEYLLFIAYVMESHFQYVEAYVWRASSADHDLAN
jgi:hypothetical protein